MSNAGYGNHDAPKPGSAKPAPAAPDDATPDPSEAPRSPAVDHGEVATPGEGAGAGRPPPGGEADPGLG